MAERHQHTSETKDNGAIEIWGAFLARKQTRGRTQSYHPLSYDPDLSVIYFKDTVSTAAPFDCCREREDGIFARVVTFAIGGFCSHSENLAMQRT